MFLRNNLAKFGIGVSQEPHASMYWIEETEGVVRAVFGKSTNGYMMVQAPHTSATFWLQIAKLLAGSHVRGITGVPEQVDAALAAFGLARQPFLVNKDEPLYRVNMTDVVKLDAEMRLADTPDFALLSDWFTGYALDTGLTGSPEDARAEGEDRAKKAIANPDVMMLLEDGVPVAMAGINARVADLVQIGGVYTPPAARGKGLARRAVSGLLGYQKGVRHSILFAADAAAARAYEAIGYKQIGAYRVAMLRDMHVLEGVK
jgi:RimJ/RimL family protein N-acetyltransferase